VTQTSDKRLPKTVMHGKSSLELEIIVYDRVIEKMRIV